MVARGLAERGALIVGLADVAGGVADARGLDLDAVDEWVAENRFLRGLPEAEATTRIGILETPCDVLVPAALERQLSSENVPRLDCGLVVEAANGPTTPEADALLAERGIPVVPDLLANGGGVTVSYFEWVQDQQKFFWDTEQVTDRLRTSVTGAFERTLDAAERLAVDWRTAAQAVAIERVAEAARLRGIFP